MNRPGFMENAALGLVLSVAGAASLTVLAPLTGVGASLKLVTAALAAAYMVHLLCRSPERTGRLVVPCLWALCTAAGWVLLTPAIFAIFQAVLVWLVRALYVHAGVLAALGDLLLTAVAVAAASWALGTGSVLLTLWSFFLVQALFTWIPSPRPRLHQGHPDDDDGFADARVLARAALERLATEGADRTR